METTTYQRFWTTKQKILLYIFSLLLLLFTLSNDLFCIADLQDELTGESLLELSLEELLDVSVKTGNITGLSQNQIPVSVTIITANDIENTPARNIYDIIEIYVPGAIFFNHYDSPHIGMRGIITDRNYKFLLLVNGRNMNLNAHNGATSELELWDMTDIEKIEIIRGPGSVTYGPGAVAGIINIQTKIPTDETIIKANANLCTPYSSAGVSANINTNLFGGNIYSHFSIQSTKGYEDPVVYAPLDNNIFNYMGYDKTSIRIPMDYRSDYGNQPQLKFHIQYDFLEDWSFSTRYTRQGSSQNPAIGKSFRQFGYDSLGYPALGAPFNLAQTSDQHFTASLKNILDIKENVSLSSLISFSSESYIRNSEWMLYFLENSDMSPDSMKIFQDVNNICNHEYDFSETSLLGSFILNSKISENIDLAIGLESSYNFWGPSWGKDSKDFRMGDNGDIISGIDSHIYGSIFEGKGVPAGEGYFVGNGWNTITYSFLTELLWNIDESFSLLVSARSDKNTYSKWLFSPRIALNYELFENNILKLVIQQSQRMNTSSQLLIQHLSNIETEPETLNSIELLYSGAVNNEIAINTSIFYNDLDVISWYNVGRTTIPTGNLDVFGIELDGKYTNDFIDIIFNQSYIKQVNWVLADNVFFSGISYSDYYLELSGLTFSSYGNDLTNWSNFAPKLIINYKMFDEKLVFHVDSRVFWGFEGGKSGIELMKNAIDTTNSESNFLIDIIDVMEEQKMFDADFRLNAQCSYLFNDYFKISIGCMNLLSTGNSKRYTYDSGIKKEKNFFRGSFIEEPTTFFFKIDIMY